MLRGSPIEDVYRRWFVGPVSVFCIRARVGPTTMSLAALLAAWVAAIVLVIEPALGGALYLLSGLFDSVDGEIARERGRGTRGGAFLDSLFGRYAEFAILLGVLGFYARSAGVSFALCLVLLLAGFGSWMVSYAHARAEGLGADGSFGFFDRPERVLLIGGAALASPILGSVAALPGFLGTRPILAVGLVILAVGANTTALTRLGLGYERFLTEDHDGRVIDDVKAYLSSCFPASEVRHDWDESCGVYVFRVFRPQQTMLLEFVPEVIDNPRFEVPRERLASWRVATELAKHMRVRVTPSGIEPLPWQQLEPAEDPLEEQLRESFPASDPISHSSVS